MGWEDPDPAEVLPLLNDQDWSGLADRYDPNYIPQPFERCLQVARADEATCVVVETRYVDTDYRSEFSSFFSKTFANVPDTAHRLHFFRHGVEPNNLTNLSDADREGYVGYIVVRPSPLGRVGRTMLAPPPELADSTLVTSRDHVHFFGQELHVEGIPFAQQDTQFGRCAHVAAWICHYSGYLRRDVSRRPMAEFSLQADASVAEGRPFPSQGLTGLQLSNLMREFDLPPIMYRMGALPESGVERPLPPHDPDEDPGLWDTRAVPILCRYLNSGYPVLVGNYDHAFVIVGYTREIRNSSQRWIRFVRHDDQRGPYLWVDDILNDIDPATGESYSPWQLLLAPVPEKLWLMPEAAERTGRSLLMEYDQLASTGKLEALDKVKGLAYRTSAVSASRYKASLIERGMDEDSVRELRLARMSRFVWVVEAIDRDLRDRGVPAVIGEAVFDSTSSDLAPQLLALRVPGALLVNQTNGTIRSPLPSTQDPTASVRPVLPRSSAAS